MRVYCGFDAHRPVVGHALSTVADRCRRLNGGNGWLVRHGLLRMRLASAEEVDADPAGRAAPVGEGTPHS